MAKKAKGTHMFIFSDMTGQLIVQKDAFISTLAVQGSLSFFHTQQYAYMYAFLVLQSLHIWF